MRPNQSGRLRVEVIRLGGQTGPSARYKPLNSELTCVASLAHAGSAAAARDSARGAQTGVQS